MLLFAFRITHSLHTHPPRCSHSSLQVFLAYAIIARATFFCGLFVSGSRTHSTASSFPWLLRDICITIRKVWWHEHFLRSELLSILRRVSAHIHSQPLQKQTTSLWLAFVEIRIHTEDTTAALYVCCNVQKILAEYLRPTTGFTLAGISSEEPPSQHCPLVHSLFGSDFGCS